MNPQQMYAIVLSDEYDHELQRNLGIKNSRPIPVVEMRPFMGSWIFFCV